MDLSPTLLLAAALGLTLVLLLISRIQLARARRRLNLLNSELGRIRGKRVARAAGWAVRGAVGTAVRMREQGVGGLLRASIEDLTGLALAERKAIDKVIGDDGTVTILFSDIEDSTRLNEQLGDQAFVALLDAHDELVRRLVEKEHGHVVKSQGDGFMIAFGEPEAAIRVATSMQRAISGQKRTQKRALRRTPIQIRIGMHSGKVVAREGDYFGLNVAMAARVTALAEGGEILASAGVRDRVDSEAFRLRMPAAELKGIPGTHQLWSVEWDV